MTIVKPEIVVIGAGIVGLSVAAVLAPDARVTVLEAEAQPAYHSSGRSAAAYIEPYLSPVIGHLTQLSRGFFAAPPPGFAEAPLLAPRGGLMLADADQAAAAAAFLALWREQCPAIRELSVMDACLRLPGLRGERLQRVLFDPEVFDIDVHALITGHRRRVLQAGGAVRTNSRVVALERTDRWHVRTDDGGTVHADIVVNAAGAWGEVVGRLAGAAPVGLVPKRRTACLIDAPPGADVRTWPMVHDIRGTFYFRPDAGRLMVSPSDETPSEPCDAQPEEFDVAVAVDRAQQWADLPVRAIAHRWAGLRSFVRDKRPVVGYAPAAPGFFWLVGQGGFGVQTSPALARIARCLILGEPLPDDIAARGIHEGLFAPERTGLRVED